MTGLAAETARDFCPLSKASCDPLANGCDGECETGWLSYVCTGGRHGECSGVAWQPDVTCECACHKPRIPPAQTPMDDHGFWGATTESGDDHA